MTAVLTTLAGLISVYVLLALIVSQIGEWISAVRNQRGHFLERGICALLGATRDPQRLGAARQIVDYLYAHPLIENLGTDGLRPSYIPPRTFSISFVSALQSFTSSQAADDAAPAIPAPFSTPDALLADLRQRIVLLPDGNLRQALFAVLQGTATTYESALASIDTWFDVQMRAVTALYKRWIVGVHLVLAAIVVCLLNADTTAIVNQLARSSASALALSNSAQSASSSPNIGALLESLSNSGLSLGWLTFPVGLHAWVAKLFGLLITWFAILLGAPFWFDLLKQIVPVRIAGTKSALTDEAAKGDAQAVSG